MSVSRGLSPNLILLPHFSSFSLIEGYTVNLRIFANGITLTVSLAPNCISLLTLTREAGGVFKFRKFKQVKLHNALSNENFKINVFLKKCIRSISCQVHLSEKRCFWRFIRQKVREIICFSPFSYISGGMGVFLTPLTPSTT
jgi:hypothetical protein